MRGATLALPMRPMSRGELKAEVFLACVSQWRTITILSDSLRLHPLLPVDILVFTCAQEPCFSLKVTVSYSSSSLLANYHCMLWKGKNHATRPTNQLGVRLSQYELYTLTETNLEARRSSLIVDTLMPRERCASLSSPYSSGVHTQFQTFQ